MTNQPLSEPLLPLSNENSINNSACENEVNDNPNISSTCGSLSTVQLDKSKNINRILIYSFFIFSGRSLWNQSVLPAFVYFLKGKDPMYVGVLAAIMGMTQVLSSFPTGILADLYRRDSMLKVGSGVGTLASAATFVAVKLENFVFLGVAMGIWGLFWGISNTAISALFADSIPDGDRSYYFTQRSMLQYLGFMMGPLVALGMFTWLGDEWSIRECSLVICVGQCFCIPVVLFLCTMNDDYCLVSNDGGEGLNDESEISPDNVDSFDQRDENANVEEAIMEYAIDEIEHTIAEEGIMEQATQEHSGLTSFLCIPSAKIIPTFIAISDVLGGLGAGLSIRYFPIFFLENLQMRPESVQITFICSAITIAMLSQLAQRVGKHIGRVQTTVVFKWTGIMFLIAMVLSYQNGLPTFIICACFVLRTASINATRGLTRSVLMDEVPKNERAKWSSLEAVNMFSWAGSAIIGGMMVDKEGILANFYFTALWQFISSLPLLYLFGKVRSEHC